MCTATNKKIVEEIVYEFVKAGRMFTAFDVTREAKARGADESHTHMKGSVHAMQDYMEDHGYERTLIDVGMQVKPWLYYPELMDPDDYVSSVQVQAPNAVSATVAPPVKSVSGQKLRTATPDKEGRVCVGGDVLRKASILPGDKVGIRVTANEAIIEADPRSNTDIVLQVHADGRVRINPTTLKGMGDVKRFQIEIEAHSVHLKSL